ncbi:amidohydrolase family protein [Ornithinimicrobium pekingense]|uniref:Amidohydrolase n=1 Tax=Ornithinimicrobium pekingense TaxID=384677 RepID=A0ABQ2FDR7_9MICO|nr:amidohydrolase family protein [Ornithinimicrobium pekingense]GGK82424.1 amidohydrolase [Ornithinimicrobium pekingense]
MTGPRAPRTDAEVPAYLAGLGVPGLADVHVHFHPDRLMERIWAYFDEGERHYGMPWPIHYRTGAEERLRTLAELGVHDVPALTYAHRPGMAASLNAWCREFADAHPQVLRCATLYPEEGVTDYVAQAVRDGVQLVKVHVTVSDLAPDDERLGQAWGLLARAGVPVVIHAGHGPREGRFSGPERVARVLADHPDLTLVVAHMGMPDYDAFADLVEAHERVHLDTTMVGTDFMERVAPVPARFLGRLAELRPRVLLGTDFPNIPYPYAHQLEALHRWGLGEDWLRDVLWHNGRRLLGLDASVPPSGGAPVRG